MFVIRLILVMIGVALLIAGSSIGIAVLVIMAIWYMWKGYKSKH